MIQGEPLEETTGFDAEVGEAPEAGSPLLKPSENKDSTEIRADDFLARTMETTGMTHHAVEDGSASAEDLSESLDRAVFDEIETVSDAVWRNAENDGDDESEKFSSTRDDPDDDEVLMALSGADVSESEPESSGSAEIAESVELQDTLITPQPMPEAVEPDQQAPVADALTTPVGRSADEHEKTSDTAFQSAEDSKLGLQAINVLSEKINNTEERYDGALNKIGHALGVIAERIDGLENRITNQAITNVAMAAAPTRMEVEDDSVAPYIARAERELEAKKESGPMDIFDRIAQAAESEFDGKAAGPTSRKIIDNASDGRRVGTKRWQPSKTVKRRMEQLEKAKLAPSTAAAKPTTTPTVDAPHAQDDLLANDTAQTEDLANRIAAMEESADSVVDKFDNEEDDSGLSVVPGARGRRRNRARKSRLDEDFEGVFAEEDGKPSIQSIRRKMRDRPANVEEEGEPEKKSMLGGLLGGKKSKATPEPILDDDTEEDEDLMAAFESPQKKPAKGKKVSKSKVVEDDFDDDEDEETGKSSFAGGPLLYVLIAGLAAAGFGAYKMFLG